MICNIYKSLNKQDTYVYISGDGKPAVLPDALLSMLGKLEWVMELELTSETRLARVCPKVVLAALESRGFFLQLPPGPSAPWKWNG